MKSTTSLFLLLFLSGCGGEAPVVRGDPVERAAGERAFLEGDYAEASLRFSLAAEAGDREAAVWQGRSLMKMERWSPAERAFRDAAPLPGEPGFRARLGLGESLLAQGRPDEAASELRALASDPRAMEALEPAAVLFKSGVAEMRCGNWDESARRLRQVSRGWPESPWALQAEERARDLSDRRFSVQLGVYSLEPAADKRVAYLRSAGIAAAKVLIRRGGADLYSVRSGAFLTYREAAAETVRLRGLGEDGVVAP